MIRDDILKGFPELFGTKKVNGRAIGGFTAHRWRCYTSAGSWKVRFTGREFCDLRRTTVMMISKRFLAACAVILFAGGLSFLAAANSKTETWKGYVTDTWCGLHRETEKPTVACTNLCLSNKGAKYALFDVVNNKLYVLNPQDQAAKYAAQLVTVTGTLTGETQMVTAQGTISGSTILASSISAVPSK